MKKLLLFIVLVAGVTAIVHAQKVNHGASVKYSQFMMTAYPQPGAADAPGLPLLSGRLDKGKREQFGVAFGAAAGSAAVIDFLDASGKAIKTIAVNDLLGKGTANGVKLLRASSDETGARSEAAYEVQFGKDANELVIRALSIVDGGEKANKLLLSFSLKEDVAGLASVRLSLPVDGQGAAQENGFVVSSKTQPLSISAAVYPKPQSVVLEKNSLVIKCNVSSLSTKHTDAPLVWLIAEGAGAKTDGAAAVKKNAKYASEPSLVIITTADKQHTQPADTVMYSVVCTNIGLGNATEVELSNPIPAGTSYVEGSAAGQGTDITIDRTKATSPQRGAASVVRWKLKGSLQPGAEKIVSFKVIVQ